MATTFEVLFLGNLPLIDTVQGNEDVENADALLGSYGTAANPLSESIQTLSANNLLADDNDTYDTDNRDFLGIVAEYDSFRINGGLPQNFDALTVYNATLTYFDGTTATITAVVFQDVNGNTYLAPEMTQNADQEALTAKPIQTLSLTSVLQATGDLQADRAFADFKTVVDGTTGDDSISLTSGYVDPDGDVITNSADFVLAGSGNDTVQTASGNDVVYGELGDDVIDGGNENDTLYGGVGADTVLGGNGDDVLYGGDGDDHLQSGLGADIVFGDAGNDVIAVSDDHGTNTIDGGADYDQLVFATPTSAAGVTVTWTGNGTGSYAFKATTAAGTFTGIEQSSGTNYADTYDASADSVGVSVYAWDGDDTVTGGTGADRLFGQAGNDVLSGGAGADTLDGDVGNDSLLGGDGADSFFFGYAFGFDTVIGGEGGNDLDTIDLTSVSGAVTVTYTGDEAGTITDGSNTITFSEIERLILTDGSDSVSAAADSFGVSIDGRGGEDTIADGQGNDSIDGGDGADTLLYIEGGADTLSGGADADFFDIRAMGDAVVSGGETTTATGRDVDRIDIGPDPSALTVDITSAEAGTISDGVSALTFSGIEELDLGSGDDTVNGGSDSAGLIIEADAGDDVFNLSGTSGANRLFGEEGNDSISSGSGNDTLDGGLGDDLLDGGAGNDLIVGGDGNDTLTVGNNSGSGDSLFGGFGNDRLSFELSNDAATVTFSGDGAGVFADSDGDSGTFSEIEAVTGSSNADSIDAQLVSSGVDLAGGGGNDTILGGLGDDTLTGGQGDDSLSGGDGNDRFEFAPGDGLDTISDFNLGNTGALLDGDATNNDFADLTGYYDSIFEVWADQADDGVLNQSNTTDTKGYLTDYADNAQFGSGEGLVFSGASADSSFFTTDNTGVVCFAKGTMILTAKGEVPIERLSPGDSIITRDNGPQPLLWVASRRLGRDDLARSPKLRPIRLAPELIGADQPLIVSPQHGVLFRDDQGDETLVRATHLARMRGGKARVMQGCRQVSYFHLAFEAHQIIFANGAATESFYPGPQAMLGLAADARSELAALFPELEPVRAETTYGKHARPIARYRDLPDHLGALAQVTF